MNQLVEAARSRIGTRFRHRGRKSSGLDCAGLGWWVYHECGVDLPDHRLYGREPHRDGLVYYIRQALGEPIAVAPVYEAQLQVADVIVMRFDIEPHHVAILGDYVFGGLSVIHADGHTGRVVEHRLATDHISRITHVFRRAL